MEYETKDTNVTVQGRDTPVPVRGSSGRAGSPGPSACDRSASPAGTQAGEGYKVTGVCDSVTEEDRSNPFVRSHRIARTPPQGRSRLNSLPDRVEKLIMVNLCNEDTNESEGVDRPMKKRKAEKTPPAATERRLGQNSGYAINKVHTRVSELATFCKQNTNVHKEIKKTALELGALMERVLAETGRRDRADEELEEENSVLRRKIKTLESKAKQDVKALYNEIETLKAEREVPKNMETDANISAVGLRSRMVSAGTQTERMVPIHNEDKRITREEINGIKDFKGLKDILGLPWHPKAFRKAFLASGTPLRADRDTDLVVLAEERLTANTGNTTLYNAFAQRYPMLNDMEGKLTTMEVSTTTEDRSGTRITTTKAVHRAEIDNSPEDWFDIIKTIKEKIVRRPTGKLVLYPPSYDKGGRETRKMAECILQDSEVKCLIYPGGHEERGTRSENRTGGPERKNKSEALIIQQEEGKSYTDMLKKIKENVKADSKAASGIKRIRKIRDGNMIIVLEDKEKEAILELKKQVEKNFKVRQVGGEDKISTLYLKDIDGITTREEVREAIARETGADQELIQVSELRPFFGGNQAATVNITDQFADPLSRKGKIRVGLSWCSVQRKVQVVQCYKCWGYGHRRQECDKNCDYVEACLKCGQKGHKTKDCTNVDYCLLCKEQGHRAGSGRCPEHRKALTRARLNDKKRRAY